MTDSRPRTVPSLAKARAPRLPSVNDTTLSNGVQTLAVRRPGVALVEVRLRVPFAGPPGRRGATHTAQAALLSDALLLGTRRRDAATLAQDLQALGGQLSVSADADRLGLSGSVLAGRLPDFLALLGELLTEASFPKDEVTGERDRLVQELAMYRSQPSVIAREALLSRMYGDHPYGRDLPTAQDVAAVRPAQLRALHAARVVPAGSVLTLVGDLTPAKAVAAAEAALRSWASSAPVRRVPPGPAHACAVPLLIDRPGAVQTTVRMARPVPPRTHPDYAAISLANLVFGGYFSSRWVANIREDKGYTYSPHAAIEHPPAGSRLSLSADVATEVTAPALLETWYELGRVATVPVAQAELDQARRYAVGSLALGTSSQAGVASTLSQLAGAGLGLDWLKAHQQALGRVTVDDVLRVGQTWFSPTGFSCVLVGDAAKIASSVSALGAVETR